MGFVANENKRQVDKNIIKMGAKFKNYSYFCKSKYI